MTEEIAIFMPTLDIGRWWLPFLIRTDRKIDDIMSRIHGHAVSVNTNLNILQNDSGHVFVEMILDFSYGEIHEEFLIYANESIEFFESF